ncbi:hypothetical protein Pint_32974 [Pistacia integerrima]|uniref:Uncharacterized protein n=1 Tax=Pistacia integerrima TaxID=434235 RepID=A0ACC0X215_9ROSI|nr:hypothetical protein Pint_32974 [Pistacia integerrima]
MISNETGQILITNIVCNMLRTVMDTTPEDLVAVVYLVANKIAPAHVGLILEFSSNVKHFVAKELDIDILVFNSTFQFIFSTAIDGKIKAWPYDNMGSRVDYDAPGLWCTTMLYSADGSSSAVVTSISPVISKVECVDKSSPVRPTPIINGVESIATGIEKPRNLEEVSDEAKPWELTEIVNLVQCRAVTMPEGTDSACKAARLLYTNSGVGILALGSNGVQKLWKWGRSEQNPGGKATASVVPQHWHPSNGLLMANDVPENSEEAVPCIALSKNDSYVMSACGGKVSLFNMMNS